MSKFISNLNEYMKFMDIKQSYLSLASGIDVKKLSRIIRGVQDVNSSDMERIAKALGKSPAFFLQDSLELSKGEVPCDNSVLFFIGEPSDEHIKFAEDLILFLENIDVILSAKKSFLSISGDQE